MRAELRFGARLVMHRKAFDHRGAGFVEPDHFDLGALAAKLQYRLVEGADRGNVPEMRLRSEEHTSELQSLMRISYAVFCLKKKRRAPEFPQYAQLAPLNQMTDMACSLTGGCRCQGTER